MLRFIAYILSYCTCVSYYNTYYYVHAAIVVRFMVIRHHFLFCGLVTDEDSAKLLRVISFVLANGIAFFVVAIGEKWNHLDTLLHGNNKVYPTRCVLLSLDDNVFITISLRMQSHHCDDFFLIKRPGQCSPPRGDILGKEKIFQHIATASGANWTRR